MAGYLVPVTTAEFRLTVKGSRFLSFCSPAPDVAAAEAQLAERRRLHHDATHHCWAYRIGIATPLERSADAGEPSGSAGRPILDALRRAGFTDAILVVTRWFGGTKLGKGNLARAYSEAASGAIALLKTELRIPTLNYTIDSPYELIGVVERCIAAHQGRIIHTDYAESTCIQLEIPAAAEAAFRQSLIELSSNRIRIISNE